MLVDTIATEVTWSGRNLRYGLALGPAVLEMHNIRTTPRGVARLPREKREVGCQAHAWICYSARMDCSIPISHVVDTHLMFIAIMQAHRTNPSIGLAPAFPFFALFLPSASLNLY